MSKRLRVGLIALGAVGALAAAVAWYLGPIAPIATGYAAKTICSGHFVADRPVAEVERDLPDNPLVPFLQVSADESAGTVRATLVGLWRSTAYSTAYGCTLAAVRPDFPAAQPAPEPEPGEWPAGDEVDTSDLAGIDADALAAAIDAAFTEDDPQGRAKNTRAVVVVHDGRIVAERYAGGFDADTEGLGWSMTKSVANAMVGRLVLEGVVDVGDDQLLPMWDDERGAITLDDLLRMRSGLQWEEVYDPATAVTEMLYTPTDTGAFAASRPLVAPVGTSWYYSSGTSNIVCDVLHDATGEGPTLAHRLVFEPLGMRTAVLEPDHTGGLVCSSFLYATARDWARFGLWFLQEGEWDGQQLLPDDWIEYTTTPTNGNVDPEHPYGAHWWLNEAADGQRRMPSVPRDAYWASGNEGQHVVVVPSADTVVVRLGFTSAFEGIEWGLEQLVRGVLDAVKR